MRCDTRAMRVLQTTLLAAAAAAVQQAAAMRPAALHPTAAMRPPAPMQPTAMMATRRCILAAPVATLPWRATAPLVVALPFRANALYDTKTVDAAKNTYDVADATKCKAYLPLLDASGKTLDELSTNWDRIATDGDNVRRYLGTVGVTSPLFKIRGGLKGVLKATDLPDSFDAVAFGTKFLANPDLPARIAAGAALNDPKADLFYTGKVGDLTYTGPEGYTDYPTLP